MPELSEDQIAAITKSVSEGFDEQIAYTQKLIRFGGQRGKETEVQNFVYQQFTDRGYDTVRFDMDEQELSQHIGAGKFSPTHSHAPIVVGTHKPKTQHKDGKSLILNGHIDVVPVGPVDMWKDDPYSARIEGDKLYGRGAGDMRSGHAANLWAMDALRRVGLQPASKVIMQSVVEEESTGNGTLMTHLKGYKADAALIPEPMEEQLVRANVGVLWFQIEVRGKPVHVRAMATGTNAIDACWKVIGALREVEADWNERHVNVQHFEKEKHPLSKSLSTVVYDDNSHAMAVETANLWSLNRLERRHCKCWRLGKFGPCLVPHRLQDSNRPRRQCQVRCRRDRKESGRLRSQRPLPQREPAKSDLEWVLLGRVRS